MPPKRDDSTISGIMKSSTLRNQAGVVLKRGLESDQFEQAIYHYLDNPTKIRRWTRLVVVLGMGCSYDLLFPRRICSLN